MQVNEDFLKTFIYAGDFNLIIVLLILMFIDIITGVMKGISNQKLWSRKSLFGFARKILVLLIIVVANLIDYTLNLQNMLLLATVSFYILNEILSIIENSAELGLPIPKEITEKLAVMRKTDSSIDYGYAILKEKELNEEKKNDKRRLL